MTIRIKHMGDGSVSGEKRQQLPVEVQYVCPQCSFAGELDYSDRGGHYLSYPRLPGLATLGLYCPECYWSSEVTVRVEINVKLVE